MPFKPPVHRPPWTKSPEVAERERKAAIDARRPSSSERGYDSKWRALRAVFIRQHPVCCIVGCDKPTSDIDHILDIAKHPELRLMWSNLRPFCRPHHSAHTARTQGFAKKQD